MSWIILEFPSFQLFETKIKRKCSEYFLLQV